MEAIQAKTIVLLGTLDTKGLELGFVRDELARKGYQTIVVDDGILGQPRISADIGRDEVARAGGRSLESLIADNDRPAMFEVMTEGTALIVQRLYSQGRLHALFALGGSMGMSLAIKAMKSLPLSVPKLLLVTHLYPGAIGEADMTIMLSPTDIMGLNPIAKRTLARAAGAIAGMVEAPSFEKKTRSLIGITAAGVTTPGVMKLQSCLEARGYDTVVFHVDTYFLDQLVREGALDGIVDFTLYEMARALADPDSVGPRPRLEAAVLKGLPQVIVPGGLDMIILRVPESELPAKYRKRKTYIHNPYVTGIRTTKEDLAALASVIADRANRSTGPVAVVIPRRGFSEMDREGEAFYDPEADAGFASELRRKLKPGILYREVEAHVNDAPFAEAVAQVYDEMCQTTTRSGHDEG